MLATLSAWLVERGQAPLAGYLASFVEEYAPRYRFSDAAFLLVCLALATWLLPRWAGSAGDDPDSGGSNAGAGPAGEIAAPGEETPGAASPGEVAPPGGTHAAGAAPRGGRGSRIGAVVVGVLLALAFQRGVLGTLPHIADEATYLFEAHLVTHGVARAPAPDPDLVARIGVRFTALHDGGWIGGFPPGWPLVLAIFLSLGLEYLATPLLLGLNLWLLGLWVEGRFDTETADLACWLGALSPLLVPLHASLMADPLTLACLLGFLLALEGGRPGLAGLSGGWAILTRPASLFFVAGATLWSLLGWGGGRGRALGRFLLGGLPALGVLLAWNWGATGSPWTSPYALAAPAAFQAEALYEGLVVRHDGVAALVNLGMNGAALGVDLLGWPSLSWLPVLLGLVLGGAAPRGGAWRGGALGLLLGHAGYFHPGFAYGPRFYLPLVPGLLAAAALGLAAVSRWRGVDPRRGVPRLWLAGLPALVLGYGSATAPVYLRYTGVDSRPRDFIARQVPREGRLLVLVPARGYPSRPLMFCFHGEVDPFLEARVVVVEDPGDPELVARWARETGRTPWRPPGGGAPWVLPGETAPGAGSTRVDQAGPTPP